MLGRPQRNPKLGRSEERFVPGHVSVDSPPTFAFDDGLRPDPCKGGPSAPACGGFGLDKGLAAGTASRQEINGQDWTTV